MNERDALVLIDRRLSSLVDVIDFHARLCNPNPEGVTIQMLEEIRTAVMRAWDAVPYHLAVKREWKRARRIYWTPTEPATRTLTEFMAEATGIRAAVFDNHRGRTITPQQEHAITETALRMRRAEKKYYARHLYGDVTQVRQEMLEARADLYALLDGALLRDLTPAPPVL